MPKSKSNIGTRLTVVRKQGGYDVDVSRPARERRSMRGMMPDFEERGRVFTDQAAMLEFVKGQTS